MTAIMKITLWVKKKNKKKNPFLNHFILLWAASYTEWMLGTIYRLDALLEYSLINRSDWSIWKVLLSYACSEN